ncbi:antitoxin protein of toxin-antitoxin system [Kribbella sp. VKM Ac-2571]|uniref:antitoxin n=1 Tax=Kribbella sp. VKM Ac-2571 TaxID=2512222 RepID=UPI0010EFD692|nr:antitoxin [Kribbella sp. VKM Ac-2571]TDO60970.1 antitoxin protein of toxin-antitoxin system [Kribbella sp. VKM Ac-2571]
MNDFQEQAKNWLRNVVKQNPDKIKAGVEKAGDLIDKQTGGKYAEKVDAVRQKVGGFVDKQNSAETPNQTGAGSTPEPTEATTSGPVTSGPATSGPAASERAASEPGPAGSESAVAGSESTAGASAGTAEAAPGESAGETASDERAGSQGSGTNS